MSNYPVPGPTPAGWYPDPEASDVLRWWDGYRWTDDFAPRAIDPADSRNGYATASLVFGIVSIGLNILLVPSTLAIGFGVAGLTKAHRMHQGRGMSIAGIVLGGVGVGVITMLVFIVLFSLMQVRSHQ